MGVCCSKDKVVKVNENITTTDKNLLITENVGEHKKAINIPITTEESPQDPHVPVIQEHQAVSTQETEAINTYNKQDHSAARSTLIFPSYTGYRNPDRFGVAKKNSPSDDAPTALVSPLQKYPPSPYLATKAADYITQRNSPLPSRYSPLLTSNRSHPRAQPGVFERRAVLRKSGSVESGGFDSDLESDTGETIPEQGSSCSSPKDLPEVDRTDAEERQSVLSRVLRGATAIEEPNDAGVGTEDNDVTKTLSKMTASVGVGIESEADSTKNDSFTGQRTTSGAQTERQLVKMVDCSVGTENNEYFRSKKSREVQVDSKKKNIVSTATDSTDLKPLKDLSKPQTSKKATAGVQTPTNVIKTVDCSVGTENDDYFRSKESREVRVNSKKKKMTSIAVATNQTGDDWSTNKSTHDMNVGTEPMELEPIKSKKKDAGTKTKEKSYVKMVDACVGTNSDEFYRSKKSRKVKTDRKKTVTVTTGIGTNTDASPRLKTKSSPRIITNQSPSPKKRAVANSSPLEPPSVKPEEKPEPHPIIETLENAFMRFAKYGDINGDGREMNNKNWAKLCRDCEFIDNRHVLVGDVDVIFSRHKPKGYRLIDFEMFINCLNEIADKKYSNKIKDEWARREFVYQNVIGKAPEYVGITGISKTGNVDRMTDHTLYPVSHKMRFDEEGKGLGIEDKFEVHDTQLGYVQGYKDRDTYDLKMLGIPRERSGTNLTSSKLSPRLTHRPLSSSSNRS